MTNQISIGQAKRFLERWTSDPAFKKAVLGSPAEAVQTYNLDFDPAEIRLLWDRDFAARNGAGPVPEPVLEYRKFIRQKLDHRDLLREEATSHDARINSWRKRQMMRCMSQLGPEKHGTIVHAPIAVELSRGCSVGCWFCGYSAPRLSAIYRYTDDNKKLWRDTLEVLRATWGENVKYGFCYWATEPLDNPDYEYFICDFNDILDYFPQTTTAVPLRDVGRTRKLLELSRERQGFVERFSIHSLEALEQVFDCFGADELKWVELITQNEESDMGMAKSGKLLEGDDERKNHVVLNDSTIACVSGFLLNMVDRTVQLVTPCVSDSRWPKGYIIYDEGQFSDGAELESLLNNMIETHMGTTLGRNEPAAFRADLRMEAGPDGFTLYLDRTDGSAAYPHPVRNSPSHLVHPQLPELGRLVEEGNWTAGELAAHFAENYFTSPAETFHCLNMLLSFGLLKEGPE